MSKHVIFLVHGMGVHPKGWHETTAKLIQDTYSSYAAFSTLPFSDHFVIEPVAYDDEFEALREMWRKSAAALGTAIKQSGISASMVSELNQLATSTNKDSFLNTHVVDVLMYRALRQVAGMVRDSVRLQLLDGIEKQGKLGDVRWSVIAHSLGTSVVHDSLHGLYTDATVDPKANFTGITRPTCLAMIANVSRVLEDGGNFDVYTSRVRPGRTSDSGCLFYLNARHEWDPFTQPKKFAPMSSWPTSEARARGLYVECNIRDIAQINVHDLNHYLRNPLVHAPLFNALHGSSGNLGLLSPDMIATAHAQFVLDLKQALLDLALQKLKPIRLGEEDGWPDIIKSWFAMLKLQ
jgi:hypothetical protein